MKRTGLLPLLATLLSMALVLWGCEDTSVLTALKNGQGGGNNSNTTSNTLAPVNLGTADNYVILAKTIVSTAEVSTITGDIGLSPAYTTSITGFGALTNTSAFATSGQVSGKIYAADMADSTPATLTAAIIDMVSAYTDAAGRQGTPGDQDLGAGNIGGLTLAPGVYGWGGSVTIPSDITISGGANDVWIFRIGGGLTVSNSVTIILSGGAQAKNIFWAVYSGADLGSGSYFQGTILDQSSITLGTGAVMHGRALVQTYVTLNASTVTMP